MLIKSGAKEMYRNRIQDRGLKVARRSNSKRTRLKLLKASTSNSVPVHFFCACLTLTLPRELRRLARDQYYASKPPPIDSGR